MASSVGQMERLKDLFRLKDIVAPAVEKKDVRDFEGNIAITVGSLSAGIFLEGLIVLTESGTLWRETFCQADDEVKGLEAPGVSR